SKKPVIPAGPLLNRTITRHESRRFFYAGTVTVTGAPNGSVTIEGWQRNEVEISAEIELQAPTEADLSRLATLNNFVIDEDANHLRVITTGTHDRTFMKRMAKDFSRTLIGLPRKIGYHLKVRAQTHLEMYVVVGTSRMASGGNVMRL